jgi:hypothetical protein
MKKNCLLFFILLCANTIFAQKERVFSLKPGLGFTACQIHGDSYNGFNKFGTSAGISVSAAASKRLSIDLGFFFIQKGARHNQNPDKNDFTFYRVNLNYLECPLMFNYKLNKDYFINLGASAGYLINYQEANELGDLTGIYPFNSSEFGVNIGLGRGLFQNKFFIEVRSNNSIAAIRPYGIRSTVFYPNAVARYFNKGLYNNILFVLLTYHLKFTKKEIHEE